jgi:hypothetical protein
VNRARLYTRERAGAALFLCCSVLGLALLMGGSEARAAATEPPGVVERRTVRLIVLGDAEEAAALRASLGELLGRIAVELAPADDPNDPPGAAPGGTAVVSAEIDLREPGVALVRLGPGGAVRTVPQRASRAVLLEEAALVVYTASESILEGSRTLPAEPPPPAPAPLPPAVVVVAAPAAPPPAVDRGPRGEAGGRARTPWILEGSLLVSSRAFAQDESTVMGFGLGVRTHVGESRFVPGAWLFGQFYLPFRTSADPIELSTSVWSVRLEPSVELVRSGAFRLEVALGGGLDVFVTAPVSSNPEAKLGPHDEHLSPVVSTLVAGSLTTTRTARVVLAGTLDYDLQPRRYVVAQGELSTVLLEPWKLRPGLTLGFLFDMAGTDASP